MDDRRSIVRSIGGAIAFCTLESRRYGDEIAIGGDGHATKVRREQ
jgi:hypothetical protein